jgi:hypothetical protein
VFSFVLTCQFLTTDTGSFPPAGFFGTEEDVPNCLCTLVTPPACRLGAISHSKFLFVGCVHGLGT